MSMHEYEAVIGLEIHAQLKTQSKLFCSCSAAFGGGDNEHVCPVCTGMPGALPVLNESAIDMAIRLGLALNCEIQEQSYFARKNYFYPDSPKGYQISQYEKAVCENGYLEFYLNGVKKKITIIRAHLEEDAGKSTHVGNHTFINLNRCSVPLLEIVSGPEMKSPEEAAEYARTMRAILQYSDVCDGNLEEGSMRCDCNISVRRVGEQKLGTKVEIKNINSFRFVEKALEYEIERQINCLENKEKIVQETRLYDPDKNRTYTMRTKEDAHDYRYFPDPDLLEVNIPPERVRAVKAHMPEMPVARCERYQAEFSLPAYDASILTQSREMADYFENTTRLCNNPKTASNWIMGDLLAKLNEEKIEINKSRVPATQLAELIRMIIDGKISNKIAKEVFSEMWTSQKSAEVIVKEKGLVMISDTKEIESIIGEVLSRAQKEVTEYRSGKEKLYGFFVGQVMKATKGKASPETVNELLKKVLKG